MIRIENPKTFCNEAGIIEHIKTKKKEDGKKRDAIQCNWDKTKSEEAKQKLIKNWKEEETELNN